MVADSRSRRKFTEEFRVGRYLKNQLTIIVMENIAIIDNIAINEIEKNDHIFQVQLISKHV